MSAALVSAASLLWMSMGVGTVAFQEEPLEVRDMPRSSELEGVLPLTSGEVVDLLLDRVEVGQAGDICWKTCLANWDDGCWRCRSAVDA